MAALSFLLSTEARDGRLARVSSYAAQVEADALDIDALRFVVHADMGAGEFVEYDAEDEAHAEALALSSLAHFGAVSCAVRKVLKDGRIGKPLRFYDFRDLMEDEDA